MKRFGQILTAVFIVFCGTALLAHSGRTDSSGGHYNRKTGEYHYHNSGTRSTTPSASVRSTKPVTVNLSPLNTIKPARTSSLVPVKPIKITENHWQVALNNNYFKGKLEVTVSTGRVDILTEKFAIEVDKVSKYPEGIEQALKYAKATGKEPALALYIDGERGGYEMYQKAERLCKHHGVTLFLVNSFVSVNDLITLHKTSGIDNLQADNQMGYWLTTSSGVRHNRACRYYQNTKKGRACSRSEGRACKICGG